MLGKESASLHPCHREVERVDERTKRDHAIGDPNLTVVSDQSYGYIRAHLNNDVMSSRVRCAWVLRNTSEHALERERTEAQLRQGSTGESGTCGHVPRSSPGDDVELSVR